jgi:hypothetical protein
VRPRLTFHGHFHESFARKVEGLEVYGLPPADPVNFETVGYAILETSPVTIEFHAKRVASGMRGLE